MRLYIGPKLVQYISEWILALWKMYEILHNIDFQIMILPLPFFGLSKVLMDLFSLNRQSKDLSLIYKSTL